MDEAGLWQWCSKQRDPGAHRGVCPCDRFWIRVRRRADGPGGTRDQRGWNMDQDSSAAVWRLRKRNADAVPRRQVRDREEANVTIPSRIRERWVGQLFIELL